MRKAKIKRTKKGSGAKTQAKMEMKTGRRRARPKGAKKNAAKTHREGHYSMLELGKGGHSKHKKSKSTPDTKVTLKTYMRPRMVETARMSTESTVLLYRISKCLGRPVQNEHCQDFAQS